MAKKKRFARTKASVKVAGYLQADDGHAPGRDQDQGHPALHRQGHA